MFCLLSTFHIASHSCFPHVPESFEEELSSITRCLHHSLSTVNKLTIQLEGIAPEILINPAMSAAATAVRIFGPLCGAITHLTLNDNVISLADCSCTPFLTAIKDAGLFSLTHLTVCIEGQLPDHLSYARSHVVDTRDEVPEVQSRRMLDSGACDALSSFQRLSHVEIQDGHVADEQVWALLPRSLQALHLCEIGQDPCEGILLPSLKTLCLNYCSCCELLKLFQSCPQLDKLHVHEMFVPNCHAELLDLEIIMRHPVWCQRDCNGPRCPPVTHMYQLEADREWPDELAPWMILQALPTMPTVNSLKFNCSNAYEQLDQQVIEHPERLLHHIPRTFPNLSILRLDNVLSLDSDLTQLHACTSLCEFLICHSDNVTGGATVWLAAVLPRLVFFNAILCKLVSKSHIETIREMMLFRSTVQVHIIEDSVD